VPGRPHLTRRRRTAAAILAAFLLGAGTLSGCGTAAVDVSAVPSPPATCAAVLAALPATIEGHESRDVVSSARASARAWGDPSIVLRCGVDRPASYSPTGDCLVIDDIEWYVEPATGGTIFTIVGADPRVEVSVPTAYVPPSDVLVDVGNAIAATVKHPTCSG
jgi:hypothetical protein